MTSAPLKLLRPTLAILAAIGLASFVLVGIAHARYPFELEWIEGGMVDEVRRLLEGKPLYVKPTLDYVPFIYAPLWFHVAALFSRVLGVGFLAARLVSLVSTLAALALIVRFVRREGGDRLAALAAAGAFAFTYPLAASFYDLARVDALFIVLLLGGLYLVRFHASMGATVAAATLFALAFFTKQSGPIVFAPVALHLLLEDRRRGAVFTATGGALMAGGALAYDRLSDGWFRHFVFTLPAHHTRIKSVLWTFWFSDLLGPLAIVCLFSLFYLVVDHGQNNRRFHVLAAAGMLGVALAGRMHLGGWSNVESPAFAYLSILFGLGLSTALRRAADHPGMQAFALAAASLQLAQMVYDPRTQLPSQAHARAWSALEQTVGAQEGDVYVSAHGFIGPRAGKPVHAHQMALSDELRSGPGETANDLRRELRAGLRARRWSLLVIDNDWIPKSDLDPNYQRKGDIPDHGDLGPVIGWKTAQPQSLWVPKP